MRGEKKAPKPAVTFKAVKLPASEHMFVPADLHIIIPKARKIAAANRHYLAFLPWEKKYLQLIPEQYREFFQYVLPSLHARTSNVHTALSLFQLPWLIKDTKQPVNLRRLYLALILHDCGWSQVSTQGLVDSFSYNGVAPTSAQSMKPKQQHLVYGEALAYKLLDTFDFKDQPLHGDDLYTITEIIRRHDHDAVWERGKYARIAPEVKIMCDADRLWSYTYENFWLDTVRKSVAPGEYLENIRREINSYFFTPAGKARARQLAQKRAVEVQAYTETVNNAELRAALIQKAAIRPKKIVYRARQLAHSARSRRMQRAMIRENAY